jgi:hypothetical protein
MRNTTDKCLDEITNNEGDPSAMAEHELSQFRLHTTLTVFTASS